MRRRGFTLTELLVAIAIILVMATLASIAASAARTSARETATRSLIARLNNVLTQHYSTYGSLNVSPSLNTSAARGAYLRNLASAEMPDSWEDIRLIATGSAGVIQTNPQRVYKAIWESLPSARKDPANGNQYVGRFNGDAECLFMAVMQSGIADCLACGGLSQAQIGDTDTDTDGTPVPDGALEFLDAWGKPIRYVLWPTKFELPPGSGPFFSTTPPFHPGVPMPATGGRMRPLLFSFGPDKSDSSVVNAGNNLNPTNQDQCGNPSFVNFAGRDGKQTDFRADNITNFDREPGR